MKTEAETVATVTERESREIEAALARLAAAIRADFPGREPLVGYYLRQALYRARENNCSELEPRPPAPDALHRRKKAAMGEVFDLIDGAMGRLEDGDGREYDSRRRYKPIVRLADRLIARLERGE